MSNCFENDYTNIKNLAQKKSKVCISKKTFKTNCINEKNK